MLRHPNILMFQDGVESDKAVFVVTERVQPLFNYLRESKDNESQKENEISWGLYQIAVKHSQACWLFNKNDLFLIKVLFFFWQTALNFLNIDCKQVHNNVCLSSVVVNRAGEWKLTGFEYTHAIEDQQTVHKVMSTLDRYQPPEKSPVNNLKATPSRDANMISSECGVDSWGLGCLIWEIFNGFLPNVNALKNPGRVGGDL
jgi:SCY1-like protein 1